MPQPGRGRDEGEKPRGKAGKKADKKSSGNKKPARAVAKKATGKKLARAVAKKATKKSAGKKPARAVAKKKATKKSAGLAGRLFGIARWFAKKATGKKATKKSKGRSFKPPGLAGRLFGIARWFVTSEVAWEVLLPSLIDATNCYLKARLHSPNASTTLRTTAAFVAQVIRLVRESRRLSRAIRSHDRNNHRKGSGQLSRRLDQS